MDDRFANLLRRQLADGFSDLHGAEAALTVPVSERLLNDILTETLPPSAAVRDLHVKPQAGDRFTVRARLGSSAFFPPLTIALAIDRQPDLPSSPVLILRLEASGLMALAAPVLRMMKALPEGIQVTDDRIHVDLRALANRHRLGAYFEYLDAVRVNTVEGAVILTVRGHIR